jgi:hypothetical protein
VREQNVRMTANPEDPWHTYNAEVLDLLEALDNQRIFRAVSAEVPEAGPPSVPAAPPADEGGAQSAPQR